MKGPAELTVRAGADGRGPAVLASDFGAADHTAVAFPNRFHILRRLGAGGMAEVFIALRLEPDGSRTPVVVKRPLPELQAHPEFVDMFLDEARIASCLRHPNVVGVHELVREAGNCLLVMELVDGKPLSSLVARVERRKQRLPTKLAAYAVARAAAGLHHAHELCDEQGQPMQIVHRDVSPQNILISFDGEVKVIDFGIARAMGRVTHTKTGTRKGKTGYMAPEQAKSGPLDRRADVFALGIVLWELLCGRRLFVRPDEYRTMNALLIDPIFEPSRHGAVPMELERIVMRALDRDPNARHATADELRSELDAFVASVGGATARELGGALKDAFPSEMSLVPRDDDPSVGAEIGPAVLSSPTLPVKPRLYARRETILLGAGALATAGLGGVIGWLGKWVRPASARTELGRSAGGARVAAAGAPTPIEIQQLGARPLPGDGEPQIIPPRKGETPAVAGGMPAIAGGPAPADGVAIPGAVDGKSAKPRRNRSVLDRVLARKKNPF